MILKRRDMDLLRFEWLEPQGVRIVSVDESKRRFLPLYSKWLAFPGGVRQGMMERLKTLKGFRFKRHRYYNLSSRRLRQIEDFLQKCILDLERVIRRHPSCWVLNYNFFRNVPDEKS